jgi:cell wall assembly regulator SMI1
MEWPRVRDRLRAFEDSIFGAGASADEVEAAQQALGVKFPTSYIAFLREFGWAEVAGDGIYGLGVDVPFHLDLLRMTRSERTEAGLHLPLHLVPLRNNGAGDHYCLDTQRLLEGECPVVFWSHDSVDGDAQVPDDWAVGFIEWLWDFLDMVERRAH